MSYKKRYKNPFSWLESIYKEVSHERQMQAEKFFHELEESEYMKTERILHSISNKMSFHLRDIFTEEEFQCFDAWANAWLKKQWPKPAERSEEDEKIRKWLINEIKIKHHNLDKNNVDFVDKAIAWLEKKGE